MPSSITQQECMPSELIAAMAMVQRACHSGHDNETLISGPALHVAVSVGIVHNLLPALAGLSTELSARTPTISQHVTQLTQAQDAIAAALPAAPHPLTLLDEHVALALASDKPTPPDTWVGLHGALKITAMALMNISLDLRLQRPAKHDEAQCDALTMVCCQVMGNDLALNAGAQTGQFEGNAFQPLMAHRLLQSIRLLTDATTVFTEYFVRGLTMNHERISHGLASSLMLVTSRATPLN